MFLYMPKKDFERLIYSNTPIDHIHSVYEERDFIEVHGSAGGDSVVYRIYENGTIIEK